jgi:hypothetical protein
MKTKLKLAAALLLVSTLNSQLFTAQAQGTAFSYQGRLNNGANPATGSYDLTFSLFNTNTGGSSIAGPVTNSATGVTNGLFTTAIDFGPGVFTGGGNWLEIAVRTNATGNFTTLAPRQQITPTPYALFATTASNVSGTLPVSHLSGTVPLAQLPASLVTNNETSVTLGNVTVSGNLTLPVGTASTGIIYSGATPLLINWDANFFLGPDAGNLTTTGVGNTAAGDNALFHNTGGNYNEAIGFDALYHNADGMRNAANGADALFSNTNGNGNTASGSSALFYNTTGGTNTASGYEALYVNTTGNANTANGAFALYANTAGNANVAAGFGALQNSTNDSDLVAIGYQALQNDNGAISGGTDSGFGENTAIGFQSLQENSLGYGNTAIGFQSLQENMVGSGNTAVGDWTIAGYGYSGPPCCTSPVEAGSSNTDNTAVGYKALVFLNGNNNTAIGFQALFGLQGTNNTALGYNAGYSLASGNNNIYIGNQGSGSESGIIRLGTQGTQTTAFIAGNVGLGGATPQQTLSLNGGMNVDQSGLNTGTVNNALTFGSNAGATSGEGIGSIRTNGYSDSYGLNFYTDFGKRMTIVNNGNVGIGTATPGFPLSFADSLGDKISLWGQSGNHYGFGIQQNLFQIYSSGISADIAFGYGESTNFTQTVRFNADGKVVIGTGDPDLHLFQVVSAYCDGGTWVNGSDRNSKEAFTAINPRAVLEKVSALPITEWKYKVEASGTEHIGPMAQDFHAAFGLNGADDKHISTVDESGVALAAIQGLNQKLEATEAVAKAVAAESKAKDAEIQAQAVKIEDLQQSVAELKAMVEKLAGK